MKKNLIHLTPAGLFILIAAFFSSCSHTPANMKVIPDKASVIASANLASLAIKASPDKLNDMQFFKALQEEIRTDNPQLAGIFETFRKDPGSSGIDFQHNVFGFIYQARQSEDFWCMSVILADRSRFDKSVTDIIKSMGYNIPLQKQGHIFYYRADDLLISWDSDKALIIYPSETGYSTSPEMAMKSLFSLEKDITSNEEFMKFNSRKKDAGLWFSLKYLYERKEFNAFEKEIEPDILTGSTLSMCVNFENEKISAVMEFRPNEIYKKTFGSAQVLNKQFNKDLLRMLPKQQYITLSYALNSREYYKLMKEQKNWAKMEKNFYMTTGIELQELMQSIRGNIIFSIFDFKPTPMAAIIMDLYDKTLIESLIQSIPGVEPNGNLYNLKLFNTHLSILLDNEYCFISNDTGLGNSLAAGVLPEERLLRSPLGENILKYPAYSYLNLNKQDYPQEFLNEFESSKETSLAIDIANDFATDAEIKMISNLKFEMAINTRDHTNNSLYSLLLLIDRYYRQNMEL